MVEISSLGTFLGGFFGGHPAYGEHPPTNQPAEEPPEQTIHPDHRRAIKRSQEPKIEANAKSNRLNQYFTLLLAMGAEHRIH